VPTDESVVLPKEQYEKLVDEREHYRDLYLAALERCRKLELGLLGQKAERLAANDAQLAMQVLATMLGERAGAMEPEAAPEVERVREHTRQKPTGRKPLPENLPRVDVEVVPDEVERDGRDAFEKIGEEVTETVERRPASIVVVRLHKPKFVRKDRERNAETEILIAPPPELPIERGLAGPAFLADTIVRRWQDHLPLYRLESIYAREGLELARSTICGWHAELADLTKPVVDAMWLDARGSPYLCTDATGVLVQAKEKCRNGHFWVVVAPGRHVLYRYSASMIRPPSTRCSPATGATWSPMRTPSTITCTRPATWSRSRAGRTSGDMRTGLWNRSPNARVRRSRSSASCFESSAPSPTRRRANARSCASASRGPSSNVSSPGATPRPSACSTPRRWRRCSDTRATSGPR